MFNPTLIVLPNISTEMELQQQRREPAVRIKNYFEETIPRYPDVTFQEHFRMTRSTFEVLFFIIN